MSQEHFQLYLITKWDAVDALKRQTGFEFSRNIKSVAMDCNQRKAAPLVEANGVQVVIGRYQPEPAAPRPDCLTLHGLYEGGPNPDSLHQAVKAHHLALSASYAKCGEPYGPVVPDRNKTGQCGGIMNPAPGYYFGRPPVVLYQAAGPGPVYFPKPLNLKRCHVHQPSRRCALLCSVVTGVTTAYSYTTAVPLALTISMLPPPLTPPMPIVS
jgi:hypothetical protein